MTLGAAFAIFCTTLLGVNMPSSFAEGGFLEELFGGGGRHQYVVEPLRFLGGGSRARHARRHERRYAAHRIAHRSHQARYEARRARYAHLRRHVEARHVEVKRRFAAPIVAMDAPAQSTPGSASRRSVCVRSCDGYFFPIGNYNGSSQITSHQATCDKLCPEAETRLFVMPSGSDKIEDAVAARGGALYTEITARINKPSDANGKSCSCHSVAGDPVKSNAFLNDFTLRPGDSVVTPQGVRVLRNGSHYPYKNSDFLSLASTRDVPMATRGALAAIEHAMKTPRGRGKLETALSVDRKHRHSHRNQLRSDRALDTNAPAAPMPD